MNNNNSNNLNPNPLQGRPRQKVNTGGNGLLKWYQLTARQDFVRLHVHPVASVGSIKHIPLSEVRKHKTETDCWTVIRGRVYDITPYLKFHPGGVDKLMLGAGRDSTQLFDKYHSWVNIDFLLEKCLLGMAVNDLIGTPKKQLQPSNETTTTTTTTSDGDDDSCLKEVEQEEKTDD